MRIGVLTGGGDCPGLNAVIRARRAQGRAVYGDEVIGFHDAWRGVLEDDWEVLDVDRAAGSCPAAARSWAPRGSSPTSPPTAWTGCGPPIDRHGSTAFVVIGGNGIAGRRPRAAARRHPLVGVPKTIDNDIDGTEMTFGFDTAVQIATDAIDRLHTTAESHDRVMVVEVMGRHTGHIAAWAGIAGGATVTSCPRSRSTSTRCATRCAAATPAGATPRSWWWPRAPNRSRARSTCPREVDRFGHVRLGGIAQLVAAEIEGRTGIETRVTILGHVQRGGTPTAFDRVLATRYGFAAADAAADGAWGTDGGAAGRPHRARPARPMPWVDPRRSTWTSRGGRPPVLRLLTARGGRRAAAVSGPGPRRETARSAGRATWSCRFGGAASARGERAVALCAGRTRSRRRPRVAAPRVGELNWIAAVDAGTHRCTDDGNSVAVRISSADGRLAAGRPRCRTRVDRSSRCRRPPERPAARCRRGLRCAGPP